MLICWWITVYSMNELWTGEFLQQKIIQWLLNNYPGTSKTTHTQSNSQQTCSLWTHKGQRRGALMFFLSAPKPTVGQTMETLVIWDATALIVMTKRYWSTEISSNTMRLQLCFAMLSYHLTLPFGFRVYRACGEFGHPCARRCTNS